MSKAAIGRALLAIVMTIAVAALEAIKLQLETGDFTEFGIFSGILSVGAGLAAAFAGKLIRALTGG